nr:MAG TPA: hypothetical protein [Bacteriophage sp.]
MEHPPFLFLSLSILYHTLNCICCYLHCKNCCTPLP